MWMFGSRTTVKKVRNSLTWFSHIVRHLDTSQSARVAWTSQQHPANNGQDGPHIFAEGPSLGNQLQTLELVALRPDKGLFVVEVTTN